MADIGSTVGTRSSSSASGGSVAGSLTGSTRSSSSSSSGGYPTNPTRIAQPPPPLLGSTSSSNSFTSSSLRRNPPPPAPPAPSVNSHPVVSIHRPRPLQTRSSNEYVDTPLRSRASELHPAALHSVSRGVLLAPAHPVNSDNNNKKPSGVGGVNSKGIVRSQPSSLDCSILCSECGKCRCEACRSPRSPPSAWLCTDFCYCSVDSAVDYVSCLCCVKGAMYHCCDDEGASSASACADDPCGCGPPRAAARWACLALAAVPLPCLLCYWPLRSLSAASKRLYALCSRQGCHCPSPAGTLLPADPS